MPTTAAIEALNASTDRSARGGGSACRNSAISRPASSPAPSVVAVENGADQRDVTLGRCGKPGVAW